MPGIQWSKAAWGDRDISTAGIPRSFTLALTGPALVTRGAAERSELTGTTGTRTRLWELVPPHSDYDSLAVSG